LTTIGKIIESEKFKPIRQDAMSLDTANITNNRLEKESKLFVHIESSNFPKHEFEDRIEIFLDDFYIWIYPKNKTFEVLNYGE